MEEEETRVTLGFLAWGMGWMMEGGHQMRENCTPEKETGWGEGRSLVWVMLGEGY